MKKIIFLIFLASLAFYFYKSNESVELNKAKQEILGNTVSTGVIDNTGTTDKTQSLDSDISQNEKPSFKVITISKGEELITLDDLSGKNLESGEIELTGKSLTNVDKIDVYFINKDSIYPEDQYVLKQFKPGSDSFKYLASSNFKTLDFGLNEYIFTAYSSGLIFKVKLEINLPKKNVENQDSSSLNDTTSLNEDELSNFNLPNFTVKKDFVGNIKCDNLTTYLSENYKYPYWNTCRDITKDKSIGFYVLRLEGDNYYYEKHYINYEKSLYGVLILDSGTGITPDMLSDKNNELKQKKWEETAKTDELFK